MSSGAKILLLVATFAALVSAPSAQATQPNIVVIMSDDGGYSDIGFAAAAQGVTTNRETPNLDALAQQSKVFNQGYVAATLCGTSRAGLLTGMHPMRFGYENNLSNSDNAISVSGSWGLNDEQVTIAQHLKGLGYSTGAIGKWHSGFQDGYNLPLDKGFDEFFGFWGGARQYYKDSGEAHVMRRGDALYESQWWSEGDPSKYDPAKGRYVTDAFGEEAVSFINNHANEENPFFLYLAYSSPHSPIAAKQADLDHFAHITDTTQRTLAALTYAMDRSIGEVMNALEANGVDDNTIVVFLNDNGPPIGFSPPTPFRGWKGTTYEAGIRVPFLIKAPGLQAGITEEPISALDLAPTLLNAAGGNASAIDFDGYDIMPMLTEGAENPHEYMFWRTFDKWAVRKGKWKLTAPFTGNTGYFLTDLEADPGELVNQVPNQLGIVDDFRRQLTLWEATLHKPKWGDLSAHSENQFDHFVFRNDVTTTANWSTANNWLEGGTANIETLSKNDAYANAILEFTVRNDADYSANNNMTRMTNRTFMMNEFRFTGDFTGAQARSGSITGLAVVLVKTLDGDLPQIRLDATSSGTSAKFTYNLNLEMQLLHDVEITGNGTQNFVIGGRIRDHYEQFDTITTAPRNVIKSGTSKVTLTGNNTFGGSLVVNGGQVELNGATAAINGAASIEVGNAGTFTLQNGTVAVQTVDRSAGGTFNFNGGTLKAVTVLGNLTNNGGIFAPGNSPAASKIVGNYDQNTGRLQIELGGTEPGSQYDTLRVTGEAELADRLEVQLINGFTPTAGRAFQIISAGGGIDGAFSTTTLPTLSAGLFWNVMYGSNSVILAVALSNSLNFIPGDFDKNGTIDSADYTVWRDRLGSASSVGDANFDGQVTTADYAIWKSNFGLSLTSAGSGGLALGVPEPSALLLILLGSLVGSGHRSQHRD